MPRFQVQWRYKTDHLGPWTQGDEVELQPDVAELVNRDSPGVLVEVNPEEAAARKRAKREQDEYDRAVASNVPDGPIAAVLEWVDKVPAARGPRIDKALKAEKAKGAKARPTLVEALQSLAQEAAGGA